MFPIVGFLAQWILGIVGSQIEIEMIFSLARIFTNLKRCCLQTKKILKMIFVNNNWFNDPRIGCKSPSNLLEFLQRDMDLKEEL